MDPRGWAGRAVTAHLSCKLGTYKTVRARFWPWLPRKRRESISSCSLFARERVPEVYISSRPLIVPLFCGSSRFGSVSQHFRLNVTCECNKEEVNDDE